MNYICLINTKITQKAIAIIINILFAQLRFLTYRNFNITRYDA